MPSRWSRCVAWSAVGVLLAGAVACERKPAKPGPDSAAVAAAPAPAEGTARLATIPAGHELVDAKFSADGRHLVFTTSKDGANWVFHDGARSGPYEAIDNLVLRDDGGGAAVAVRLGGQATVVVDGKPGPRCTQVGTLRYAPDGRVVYSGQRPEGWVVVAGGRELVVPGAEDPLLTVVAEARRLVFTEPVAATKGFRLRACALDLTDCATGQPFEAIAQPTPAGSRLVYTVRKGDQEAVLVADLGRPGLVERVSAWYAGVALPALSSGGEHLAFLARRGEQTLLVKDGVEADLPAAASPFELVVSRAGRVLLTAIMQEKVEALLDGKPAGRASSGTTYPVFSPDGASHAWVAEFDSKSRLVVNGEEGPPLDKAIAPSFTPDGSRVIYRARRSGERFVVVADAHARTLREHPHYQAVFDTVLSADGTTVGYGVRAGAELWWKVERL